MISFDNSTNGGNTTGTSLTFSHPNNGDILHVAIETPTSDNTDYVTGVTYNGVAMTRASPFRSPGLGGLYLYELVNPATGTHDVVISTSSSVPIYGVASSHKSVRQTGQPEANNGNALDPVTSLNVNATTIADNAWLISCAGKKTGAAETISAGSGVTARQINGFVAIGDSNDPKSPPSSYGQEWSLSGSNGLAVISVSIAPTILPGDIVVPQMNTAIGKKYEMVGY